MMDGMEKPVIVSGIQPSGKLHVGNYLGALKNFVRLQKEGAHRCVFFVADLHSITENYNPHEKRAQILDTLASFIAAGINPAQSLVFVQSTVPAHAELAWILNTITPFGELARMTQFKDKAMRQEENINVGLFSYPVLQAADILLYNASAVPVGEDQVQHLELARTLARKFNAKFGALLVEPQAFLTPAPRVMSLADPTRKMSKSEPAGCLFLDDAPEEIERKIMAAVTDSGADVAYDPGIKAGVSNLILILSELLGKTIAEIEADFAAHSYGAFKKRAAKTIAQSLAPFRRKKEKLLRTPQKLDRLIAKGAKTANKIATENMGAIYKAVGLR
jgi:tryptophanyl-tRNA synthetase